MFFKDLSLSKSLRFSSSTHHISQWLLFSLLFPLAGKDGETTLLPPLYFPLLLPSPVLPAISFISRVTQSFSNRTASPLCHVEDVPVRTGQF